LIIFLFTYIFIVLWLTVLHRSLSISNAQLDPLWSYKEWLAGDTDLGNEILANIAMFVPFGFMLSAVLPKRRFIIPAAIVFSLAIETLQLVLMRGLFEWDDVISNTIGAAIGVLLFQTVIRFVVEKHRITIITSISAAFLIVCLMVVIHNQGSGGVEADSTPRAYCFQVDSVEFTDGTIELNGFAFRYEHPSSDYSLLLRAEDGTRIELEKEIVLRSDVNNYFLCDYDYTNSGFSARRAVEEGEYEVLIKWPFSIALSTGVYINSDGVHYASEKEFEAPEIDTEFVEHGVLRVYRPDFHCWVYQYEGSLYWIVDQDFNFEEDNTTYIQYQLWTTQTENLPQERLDNNWLWDNIGGNFEEYEILGDFDECRVMKRELPTEYPVTAIVTGYHKDGKWIWRNYFRPVYEF
jgi:glycopeptide antibiotics resistance protein